MANDVPGDKPVVLITGATDGLGRAAALLMAERGYRVFAAGGAGYLGSRKEIAARVAADGCL